MEQFIGKKYKLKTSEDFDEYLKYIGVGYLSRKTANAVSPVCILSLNEDGSYTLSMLTTFRNIIVTFKLNEEFIEERADGAKVKTTMVIEGNKLIQTQIEENGRKSLHIREFTPTTLTTSAKNLPPARSAALLRRGGKKLNSCFKKNDISTAEGWDGKCIRIYEIVE